MTRLHINELKKKVLFLLLVLVVGLWIIYECDEITHPFERPKSVFREVELAGVKCRIPDLEARDPRILSYLEASREERHPECGQYPAILTSRPGGLITQLPGAALSCCYRPFYRISDFSYRYHEECIPFQSSVQLDNEEFVKVSCKTDEQDTYENFFMFIKEEYLQAARNQTQHEDVSVLILGIDGISRLNFRRQMPKTFDFLKRETNMVEMFGFNKIGYNTFPNLMAMLSGRSEKEIENGCWNGEDEFDNCTFIWQRFKERGYMTGFSEDATAIGVFHYNKRGFKNKPTDMYARMFHLLAEKEVGHDYRLNANLCVSDRLSIELVLELVEKFTIRSISRGKLSFGFFWQNSLTHDFLNLPKYGDELHLVTLKKLKDAGAFEKTVVVVMSDHGIRWGSFRNTHQGYLEERLPLMIISFPKWMEQKWPQALANLRMNSDRLITLFDLYETLYDLSDLSSLEVEERLKTNSMEKGVPRGISLFLPIPKYRTCELAAIDDHWCTCIHTEPISTNDSVAIETAQLAVQHINNLLQGYRQCSKLALKEIEEARAEPPHKEELEDTGRDYWVRISVSPGTGLFESTFRHWTTSKTSKIVGTVSRSNQYGNESRCISNFQLKLYCYCT